MKCKMLDIDYYDSESTIKCKEKWIECLENLGTCDLSGKRYPLIKVKNMGDFLPKEHLTQLGIFAKNASEIMGITIHKSKIKYEYNGHLSYHNEYPKLLLKFIVLNIDDIVKNRYEYFPQYIDEQI